MRKVVSQSEVAHFWANQTQDEARNANGSFYFEGNTIYSYGKHFAIATHATNKDGKSVVLFTSRSYSSTTAKHIYTASRASSHLECITAPYPADRWGEQTDTVKRDNFNFWERDINDNAEKLATSKKPTIYLSRISNIYDLVKEYAAFFDIAIPESITSAAAIIDSPKYADAYEIQAERDEKREVTRLANQRKKIDRYNELFAETLEKFRGFETHGARLSNNYTGFDYLRFNADKNRVETSQGGEIPAEMAKKFYQYVLSTIDAGGCKNCNYSLLDHYQVREINPVFITVGCHKISISEIKLLTSKLGW
jgi:hypothetical protein